MLSPELSLLIGAVATALLTFILAELRVRNAQGLEQRVCERACAQACTRPGELSTPFVDAVKAPLSDEKPLNDPKTV